MKYINRWALMRNTAEESLAQHSLEVAAITHALAVIGNRRMGKNLDASRGAVLGMYHDMPEIITGDMPTPTKYYSDDIRCAFGEFERVAQNRLLSSLPADLRSDYSYIFGECGCDAELMRLVKAADKLSALIKCIEERKAGNSEFFGAEKSIKKAVADMNCPEADIFIEEFMGGFELTLDELSD